MARLCHPRRLARDAARQGEPCGAGGVRGTARDRAAGLARPEDERAAQRGGGDSREEIQDKSRGASEMSALRLGLLGLALVAGAVPAHEMTMAEMEMRQLSPT